MNTKSEVKQENRSHHTQEIIHFCGAFSGLNRLTSECSSWTCIKALIMKSISRLLKWKLESSFLTFIIFLQSILLILFFSSICHKYLFWRCRIERRNCSRRWRKKAWMSNYWSKNHTISESALLVAIRLANHANQPCSIVDISFVRSVLLKMMLGCAVLVTSLASKRKCLLTFWLSILKDRMKVSKTKMKAPKILKKCIIFTSKTWTAVEFRPFKTVQGLWKLNSFWENLLIFLTLSKR